jgi:outer membrane receptor protein involved in Fe transport
MAQYTLTVRIRDVRTHEPLAGASVQLSAVSVPRYGPTRGATAAGPGTLAIYGLYGGQHILQVRSVGYEPQVRTLVLPVPGDSVTVFLTQENEELDEVVVSSTRSSRSIRDLPTRVEILNSEELEEKGNMRPGDIRMMLSESTGIQTQQVSATSANSSIRIQGLDGRYTQLLKDGFPLFGGFSGGLSLLQTPQLDLKQVEVIKGASSTLYGGGAIAGLVNLISRMPAPEKDLRFIVNATSAGGWDISGFYGQQFKKTGITLLATQDGSQPYAPGSTPFTAIPRTRRYLLEPKAFIDLGSRTKLIAGISTTWEQRKGGDILYLQGKGDSTHRYFEENTSHRFSTQFTLDHRFNDRNQLTLKNSASTFSRRIAVPGYEFDGRQWSSYSELSYRHHQGSMDWIAGLNVYTDDFKEFPKDTFLRRNYFQRTAGGFVQHTANISSWLQTETGLRGDYVADYGFILLPRISALFKLTPRLTSRLGGGLGYKTPTIFTEETERIQFQSVLPISPVTNRLERSYGANFDVNYRTTLFSTISITINQLFFFTRINHPLIFDTLARSVYRLVNDPGYIDSKGWETNLKLAYRNFKLYLGYTFTDAHLNRNGIIRENPLTARHRLNNVLFYEKEEQWKLGLEAYYFSRQPLTDGTTGKPYWNLGFMAEKIWEHFSLFINFENFTNTRQTRFGSIYTGTITQPVFRDIYAPLDGFVVNGGLKLKL